MKKFLYAALIVFALGFISCGAASADEALANSMAPGTWTTNPRYLTFGEYNGYALKWRVLEVYGDKTAFLVLDDVLRKPAPEGGGAVKMAFNDSPSNNFPASEISKWLNDDDNDTDDSDGINGFIYAAGLGAYETGILDTTYGPDNLWEYTWDGNPADPTSKIFLLSVGEAINPKYFFDGENYSITLDNYYIANADRDVKEVYWLRSPGGSNRDVAFVWVGGDISDIFGSSALDSLAVRPALKINLASPVFTSDLVSYPPQKASEPE